MNQNTPQDTWAPRPGSWEEAVHTWHEQVSKAFKRDNQRQSDNTTGVETPITAPLRR